MRWIPTRSSMKHALSENYPIAAIMVGVLMFSFSIGLYENLDTVWEFKAANGVLEWGMPYTEVKGSLINQPPLGFYAEGVFLSIFGVSIETGTILVTMFGLGCIYLVYRTGKEIYGKKTGVIAAVMFAVTPWELVLSRSFLIDTQCLFFSLLTLFLGLSAVKADSHKKFLFAGIAFALGFLTKLYAVFMLLPLLLIYLHHRKLTKRLVTQAAVFLLPLALSLLIWNTIHDWMLPGPLSRGLGYMFNHSDFGDLNMPGVVPVYSFISTFLLDEGLGYFFVAAFVASLGLGVLFRKKYPRDMVAYDWMFFASILAVLCLNMYLGVAQNLKVPYTSAIKYSYQALPLFSLVAASLAAKCGILLGSAGTLPKKIRIIYGAIATIGLLILALSISLSLYDVHELSKTDYIIFNVQPGMLLGYSLTNAYTITDNDPAMYLQYVGFALLLSGLLYSAKQWMTSRHRTAKISYKGTGIA